MVYMKLEITSQTSRNCFSSPLIVHSLITAFISPEGASLLSNLWEKHNGSAWFSLGVKPVRTCYDPLEIKWQNVYILSFNLGAVSWSSREDHRLVIMKYSVLPAKLNILIPLQITLAPLCRKNKLNAVNINDWSRQIFERLTNAWAPTCVDIAVFASILRGDNWSHICPGQGR